MEPGVGLIVGQGRNTAQAHSQAACCLPPEMTTDVLLMAQVGPPVPVQSILTVSLKSVPKLLFCSMCSGAACLDTA